MTAVPAAIDGLLAAFGRYLGKVQLVDGPPTADVAGDVLAVGLAPLEPGTVQATEQIGGLAVVRESFLVPCLARSWSGGDSVKVQRDRTYRLIGEAKAALLDDPTLGGVVTRARFAGSTYTPWRTNEGQLVVDVPFSVAVDNLA